MLIVLVETLNPALSMLMIKHWPNIGKVFHFVLLYRHLSNALKAFLFAIYWLTQCISFIL